MGLGTTTSSCTLEAALGWFESLDGEWLLLFDGADNAAAIHGLWPPGIHGNIIYTSRNHLLRALPQQQTYQIDQMEPSEACSLLLSSARLDNTEAHREAAEHITRLLGYLALAIDQAGASILRGICSLQNYQETFEKMSISLLSNDAYRGASSYNRAVYGTWELSYCAISSMAKTNDCREDEREGAKRALRLMDILGFWHYDCITYDIFQSRGGKYRTTI